MYLSIINYKMGNIKSVENGFKKIGARIRVTDDISVIRDSCGVVLPGVGAFRDAIGNIRKMDLLDTIKYAIDNKPFLGICIGMQLLFEYSLEDGKEEGLGVFKGGIQKIIGDVKVPHMGWNDLNIEKPESRLLKGVESGDYFYFVHSYYAPAENNSASISSSVEYGAGITASIERDNVYGVQFHPEKSSQKGLNILRNFWEISGGKRK